jgi:hypothetical protein
MDKGSRSELLDRLAGAIESVITPHPLRLAVDGPPAAGKTTLADELALLLRTRGREVIRAPTEGFHLPRAQRYRRGEFSPKPTTTILSITTRSAGSCSIRWARMATGGTGTRSTTSTRTPLCPRR